MSRSYHSGCVMTYRHWIPSKQEWQTPSYDLASIVMLLGINVESIPMLQGANIEKVSEETRWLTILIIRSMAVILSVLPPIGVSSYI